MAKSLAFTYILWFFGGLYGLHHLYLRRYKQAFLFWCLPGGYFGAGWIRDIWRIPEYVKDANNDPVYLAALSEKMRKLEKPKLSFPRLIGQLVVGNLFAMLVIVAVPDQNDEMGPGLDLDLASRLIAPAMSALGIWLVGNVGREQGSLRGVLVGCYLMAPAFWLGYMGLSAITIAGIIVFQWKSKSWRRKVHAPGSFWRNFPILVVCGLLYSSLWFSYIYFNFRLNTIEGDEIRFRDAVGNLIRSPAFREFSNNVKILAKHIVDHGFASAWRQFMDSLDPLGEKNALKVLGLERNATIAEVKSRYRDLSRRWHPDKVQDKKEKAIANDKFVDIQKAYETIQGIKARRRKNTL